jgi:AcrR family transcriptional regulator
VNAGLVHYYFGTLDDLLLAVFQHGADRLLAREQRALTSPEPLRALWDLATDPRGTALLMEFMALANHRKAIRAEIVRYSEQFRALERETLARLVDSGEIDLGDISPGAAVMLLDSVARTMVMERALGFTGAHDETAAFVEDCLARAGQTRQPSL